MAKPDLDKVEIVEPPIGELTKHHHSFLRSCLTGGGCVVIFIIAAIIGIKLMLGPGPSKLGKLPDNFPKDVPIYDKDNIEQIVFVPGKYKSRGSQIASFFPKIILSPLISSDADTASTSAFRKLWNLINIPAPDSRDSVQIEWTNIDAEPGFILSYYKNELQKKNYNVEVTKNTLKEKELQFSNNTLSGALYEYADEENKAGTDSMMLTVSLPQTTK